MAAKALSELPLVVIVGPTASGKTALAIDLAAEFGGEIIAADSRTIYRQMDIGTAKPSMDERRGVPHWGLDLIDPDEHYSAAEFKRYAEQKIDEIRGRGHIPFIVGGTGLYVDAVLFDYQFGQKPDEDFREKLEMMTLEALHDYCLKNNIRLPENKLNKRYVIRAIERQGVRTTRQQGPITNIIVGIATDKEALRRRIQLRTEQLFEQGVVTEAKKVGEKYGWDAPGLSGNIYRLVRDYFEAKLSLADAKDKNTTLDWRLAKRQLTWLRRNRFITWLPRSEAEEYLRSQLAKIR